MLNIQTHIIIVDYDKRYLDLNDICKTCPGWNNFSEWENNGDFISCKAKWMKCFDGSYLYSLYKCKLHKLDKDTIKTITRPSYQTIIHPMIALDYITMLYYVPSEI